MSWYTVSVSADYRPQTRQLLAHVLSSPSFLSPYASLVRSRHPFTSTAFAQHCPAANLVSSLDDLERIVADLEGGRGLPVLLRQYLRLNARLLGFSVDPAFASVLDGLVLVDLVALRPAQLQRYLGREGAAAFRRRHATAPAPDMPTAA